jgi:hypothetical protein
VAENRSPTNQWDGLKMPPGSETPPILFFLSARGRLLQGRILEPANHRTVALRVPIGSRRLSFRRKKLNVKIRTFFRAPTIAAALFVTAAAANAATITINTSGTGTAGTGFNDSGVLTLTNSSGAAATLAFVPDADSTVGLPDNVNFGNFTLSCPTCFDSTYSDTTATTRIVNPASEGQMASTTVQGNAGTTAPEPTTFVLIGGGLLGIGLLRRKRFIARRARSDAMRKEDR